ASTNSSQSPPAAIPPRFRAREIWFTGSNTILAPAARAVFAVPSVELLSQTITSLSQPSSENAALASWMAPSERAIIFSSLNAGTTMEIFIEKPLRPLPQLLTGRQRNRHEQTQS